MHFYNKLTPKDTKKAIDCFEKAIHLEPEYAHAYAMAAAGYAYLGATGQLLPNEAFKMVHTYSDKALQLNSSLAAGYAAKGSAYLFYDWKWKQAHDALLSAIELNPATMSAYQLLSFYYLITGQKQEAVAIMEKALQVDPLSPIIIQFLAEAYFQVGRIEDALKQVEGLLEIHPQMRIALQLKGWCIGLKGDWQQATEIFTQVHRLTNHPLKGLTPLACAYGQLGEREKALDCIGKIKQWEEQEPGVVLDIDLAMIWGSLGEKDKAFYHFFQCVDKRLGPVAIIIDHPIFKEMATDPRYQLLKEQLNLAEYR